MNLCFRILKIFKELVLFCFDSFFIFYFFKNGFGFWFSLILVTRYKTPKFTMKKTWTFIPKEKILFTKVWHIILIQSNLGSALLCTTSDNKFLCVFGIVIMITILQQIKKRKISQIFQNKICFHFLHYTSTNEKKGHECCQEKKAKKT
jgi:hypothetical protein